ncbi:hypothetical protein ACFQX4_26740 [Roseomonas sp. GCM10028921]
MDRLADVIGRVAAERLAQVVEETAEEVAGRWRESQRRAERVRAARAKLADVRATCGRKVAAAERQAREAATA